MGGGGVQTPPPAGGGKSRGPAGRGLIIPSSTKFVTKLNFQFLLIFTYIFPAPLHVYQMNPFQTCRRFKIFESIQYGLK